MRGGVRTLITGAPLILMLFTVAGVASPETTHRQPTAVALAQPVVPMLAWHSKPILDESGTLLLAGSSLIGLASLLRKATSV